MTTKVIENKHEDADSTWVMEFPELETINLGDPYIQKQLIKYGLAVGIPGGEIIMKKSVKMVAGGKDEESRN